MDQRRIILGAIGGDCHEESAAELGKAVARAGCILLTGGGDEVNREVKNATIQGARNASQYGAKPRYIGILSSKLAPPNQPVQWMPRDDAGILLHTGLPHYMRNLINGVTPDVLIVFGGSCGTLAEAAFGAAAGKTMYFFGNGIKGRSVGRLQRNFKKLLDPANTSLYLARPLTLWSSIGGKDRSPAELLDLLAERLRVATDWDSSADALVARCVSDAVSTGVPSNTGFPGIPGCDESMQRFQAMVVEISR
jgi:hypothetical protein